MLGSKPPHINPSGSRLHDGVHANELASSSSRRSMQHMNPPAQPSPLLVLTGTVFSPGSYALPTFHGWQLSLELLGITTMPNAFVPASAAYSTVRKLRPWFRLATLLTQILGH